MHNGAETRAQEIREIYEKHLEYEEVQMFKDLSKEQVLDKLRELREIATNFSQSQKSKQDRLIITVGWAGFMQY